MSVDQRGLAARLGYSFRDPELLLMALTHRSAGAANNERLEFLGDSVLGLVITEHLYARFSGLSEGKLSRIRASLVNGEALAAIARQLAIGDGLILGQGALNSGTWRRDSVLADAVEAVIGAIYLDGGFEVSRERVLAWFAERLADPELGRPRKDSKTRLQEWLMARGQPVPAYRLLAETGPSHAPVFEVECEVSGEDQVVRASGSSRRRAEQEAASIMLQRLEGSPADD